jgi:hypothetical protein
MSDKAWVRVTAASGVAFVILIIVQGPILTGSLPTLTSSAQKVFDYFNGHQRSVKAAAALYGLAMPAVLVWVIGLFAALRKAEGGRAALALGAPLGTVLAAGATVVSAALEAVIACRITDLTPATARVLFTAQQFVQAGILFGLLLAVAATAAVVLRTGAFARWVGIVGAVLAVASIVGAFGIGYARLQTVVGIMLSLDTLFVLVLSIYLWVQPELAVA